MKRHAAVVLAVVALAALAGCMGGGGISDEQLAENATYDWNSSATVSADVATGSYKAVYTVSNRTELSLSTPTELTGDNPVSISAVQFRYSNGTVVNSSAIDVEQTDSETVVHLPAAEGQVAFTASAGQRVVVIPAAVEGSYEVALPGRMRVALPVFGSVSPGGYERSIVDGRTHLYWESLSGGHVEANYYYEQDMYIYGGVVALAVLGALAGAIYLRRQIRRLRQYREDAGLNVE